MIRHSIACSRSTRTSRQSWSCARSRGLPSNRRRLSSPWFGWFSTALKGYPRTVGLKCAVHPRDGGQRPWLELEAADHPLAVEQRDGITLDRIFEIFALNGHDMRPSLGQSLM